MRTTRSKGFIREHRVLSQDALSTLITLGRSGYSAIFVLRGKGQPGLEDMG